MSQGIEGRMMAMVTTGHGGYERLEYRAVPMPTLLPGEVLLKVLAAGMNNTDINTRVGWYSAANASAQEQTGWNGKTPFPLIQGADCCGQVVAIAAPEANAGVPDSPLQSPRTAPAQEIGQQELKIGQRVLEKGQLEIGQRVLVRSCMRSAGFASLETRWLGTDFDGAFAQYVKVPASEAFAIQSDWSDEALATLPCAYGTAENMLHRAGVNAADHVLVTGASGGVGSAVVQLALRRGAQVTALTSVDKIEALQALGAQRVLHRDADLAQALSQHPVTVVVDNVAGEGLAKRLSLLARGGRYVSSGAIGGAQVSLDWREVYLRDLTVLGCTAWDAPVFPNLVGYVERKEIKPLLAESFPLQDMARAQAIFLERKHIGNLVLVP